MMEPISSANQFVVITGHFAFLCNVLTKIAQMIEARSLQVDLFRFDYGKGSFGQNIRGDVQHRGLDDLVNKADVPGLTRRYAGDDLTPGDFGVDDRLAATSSVVDHHNEILHQATAITNKRWASIIPENTKKVKLKILKNEKRRATRGACTDQGESGSAGAGARSTTFRPSWIAWPPWRACA